MELIYGLLVAALVGGLALAVVRRRWRTGHLPVPGGSRDPGFDAINMAHIRVSGVGGLGLVAMAAGIAWAIPRIGETVILGLGLGTGLAVLWIVRRQRNGPMPSSGRGLGAHTVLVAPDAKPLPRTGEDRSLKTHDLVVLAPGR